MFNPHVLPYSFSSEENSLQIDALSNTPNLHKELIDAGVNSFEAPLRDKSRVQSSPKSSDEEEDCTSQHIHSNQEAQKKNRSILAKTFKNLLSFGKSGDNESSNKRKDISITEEESTPREKRQNTNNSLAHTQNEWQKNFESTSLDNPTSDKFLVQSFYNNSSREETKALSDTNT